MAQCMRASQNSLCNIWEFPIGACAMTTNFLDNKLCTFKILLSWRFTRKKKSSLPPRPPPPLKKRFFFYCRLAVSDPNQNLVVSNLVVCKFCAEALFCTLLRSSTLFCRLVFAIFCAHSRSRAFACFCERPRLELPRLGTAEIWCLCNLFQIDLQRILILCDVTDMESLRKLIVARNICRKSFWQALYMEAQSWYFSRVLVFDIRIAFLKQQANSK